MIGRRRSQGIFIGITAASLAAFGGAAFAATAPQVGGTVTADGAPAANASVAVVCTAAGGTHTRNAATSGTGHYSVSFSAGQCDDGSMVTATATSSSGGASGQTVGHMGDGGTTQHVTLDVALMATAPLPELPVLPYVAAALVVGAGLIQVRRVRSPG